MIFDLCMVHLCSPNSWEAMAPDAMGRVEWVQPRQNPSYTPPAPEAIAPQPLQHDADLLFG